MIEVDEHKCQLLWEIQKAKAAMTGQRFVVVLIMV